MKRVKGNTVVGMKKTGEKEVTKEDAKWVTEARVDVLVANNLFGEMIEHVKVHGTEAYGIEKALGQQMVAQLDLLLKGKAFYDMGVLAGPDIDMLDKAAISGISGWNVDKTLADERQIILPPSQNVRTAGRDYTLRPNSQIVSISY